jgi:2-polyprenyl-3-methyl-5-hydroxy-6-metoxy-1,4-benzoquinol methylase
MFLDPIPDKRVLDDIYKNDAYFNTYYATPMGIKTYIDGMKDCKDKIASLISLIKKYKESGKLLDIGCAAGMFLASAKDMGYEVSGVEPNSGMAKYARDNFGLNVICGTTKDAARNNSCFDIIRAGDVLEHMPELKEDIKIIRNMLSNDGVLAIEQPLAYNRSLFNLMLKLKMLFIGNKYSMNEPAHLWEFNAVTLREFLEKNNFKILYYKIFETDPKPLAIYDNLGMKNIIGYWMKNISSLISNSFLFKGLLLGDRAIVICAKKS